MVTNFAIDMPVPIGVLLKNENKLAEMGKILDDYMKLVPTIAATGNYLLPNHSTVEFDATQFHGIPFGDHQLTVARMRGTQILRATEETAVKRLQGILPVVEDWHTRMTFLKVEVSHLLYVRINKNFILGNLGQTVKNSVNYGERHHVSIEKSHWTDSSPQRPSKEHECSRGLYNYCSWSMSLCLQQYVSYNSNNRAPI